VNQVLQAEFRRALGHFATGLVVVTGSDQSGPAGFTCQSFFSLSLDPPLVALAPSMSSSSWPRVSSSGAIGISILARHQESLARLFSVTGADKFADIDWWPGSSGAPRVGGALGWLDCQIQKTYEAGDHYLVVALVEQLEIGIGEPLLFYRGGFSACSA
jgi:3-hydroxy-9,10-secoandrosta-1,3,5(10)-triene-9,17-dione monooxygenase reductase component